MFSRRSSSLVLQVLLCITSLFLRIVIPTRPGYLGLHDDDWMVSNANWILHGDFVRQWTILSMNKELGFPLFVAIAMRLSMSPLFLGHLLFVTVCWVLAKTLRPILGRSASIILLSALILNPTVFGLTASRVYRDMLTINLAIGLLIAVLILMNKSAPGMSGPKTLFFCVMGLLLSLLLRMTRVDTYWVLAVVLLPLFPWILENVKERRDPNWRAQQSGLFKILLVVGAICLGQLAAPRVSAEINSYRYGVRLTDDFFVGEFASMMKTWSSVSVDSNVSFTPISRSQRLAGYRVSETLRRIGPLIEGDFSSGWRSISCQATGVCDDIAGGYLAHAVRDAYAHLFPISSADQFQEFMSKAESELRRACESRDLECGARGINTQLPSLGEIKWIPTFQMAFSFVLDRSLRFNDSVSFEGVGQVDGPNQDAWNQVLTTRDGKELFDRNGTPAWLRSPIENGFDLIGLLLRIAISVGIVSLCGLCIHYRKHPATWLGISCLAGVGLHVLIIAVAAQNSMGPLSFEGVWELTYLLQETPFLVISGVMGLCLLHTFAIGLYAQRLSNRGS